MKSVKQYSWVYLLVGLGYLWVIWNMMHPEKATTTVCLFKNATGVACPSCGSTRALLSILNGDFANALMTNPLGYFGLFIMLIVPSLFILGKLKKRNLVASFFSKGESLIRQPQLAIPLVALIAFNWVWNIYKGL